MHIKLNTRENHAGEVYKLHQYIEEKTLSNKA